MFVFFVNIGDLIHWAAVHSHPQLDMRMLLQCSADLERTSHWLFRTVEEKERHPVSGRHPDRVYRFVSGGPKTFGASHDLIQLLQQLNLLIDQQFRVTDHVDNDARDVRSSSGRSGFGLSGTWYPERSSFKSRTIPLPRGSGQNKASPGVRRQQTNSLRRYVPKIPKPLLRMRVSRRVFETAWIIPEADRTSDRAGAARE